MGSIGVVIKPTILERTKHKYHKAQLFYGTGSGVGFYEANVFHFYYEKSGSTGGNYNKDLYVYNMTGSSYTTPYIQLDNIYFGSDSGSSYFNITTGSYISQYDMKTPLYFRAKDSGSAVFDFTGSKLFTTYDLIEPIYFGSNSGSYFNIFTGSYISQYDQSKPINIFSENSGSLDDYAFTLTGSDFFQPYTASNRQVADSLGLFGLDRNVHGEQYRKARHELSSSRPLGVTPSYIWDAWGTGSDDIHFLDMNGTGSRGDNNIGYYNKTFVFDVIGDVEIWSSSMNPNNVNPTIDYMDPNIFRNKTIVQSGEGFLYRRYHNDGTLDSGFVDGRAMGRTHYFATSSDGTILYPPNHYFVTKTSKSDLRAFYIGSLERPGESGSRTTFYDPLGLDSSPTSSVTTVSVAGAQTDQSIVVVNQGGINIGTGSAGV